MNIYSFMHLLRSWLQFGLGGIATSYDMSSLVTIRPLLTNASLGKAEPPSADQLYLMQRFAQIVHADRSCEKQSPFDENVTMSVYADTWPPNSYTVVIGATEFQRAADIGNINHDTERRICFTSHARAYMQIQVWQSQTGKPGRVLIQDNASTLTYISVDELAEIEAALLWPPLHPD